MNENLKRSLILQNYQDPTNRGLLEDSNYIKINMNNESCIDEIDLMFLVEDNIIKDVRFDGEACAISTSSTSIMINTILGKNINQVSEIYNNFINMIDESDYDASILEEAIVYDEIYKQPSRKKCALLPWWGLKKIIDKYQ